MTVSRLPCLNTGSVLYVDGRLRAPIDREVRHQVRGLLRRGERQIVLDLTRVSSIDASGIGELVRAHNMTRAVNGTLRVENPSDWVRHAIECAGLDAFLLTSRMTILRAEYEAS
jgi:anti-anti-sigma factor